MNITSAELDALRERFDAGQWTRGDLARLFGEVERLREALADAVSWADWAGDRLDDEHADRQLALEHLIAEIRKAGAR